MATVTSTVRPGYVVGASTAVATAKKSKQAEKSAPEPTAAVGDETTTDTTAASEEAI